MGTVGILGVFFLSGLAALVYQVVWHRSLYAIFGVNIEAVTVIVAAFMLGLGLGAFAGGKLSRLSLNRLLFIVAGLELGIALFGAVSLQLFSLAGHLSAGAGALPTFLISFTLVLVPTLLMGATLPVLSGFMVRAEFSVGFSMGTLYFANTLGAASGAYLASIWGLGALGLQGIVWAAVAINASCAAAMLLLWRSYRKGAAHA